MVSEQLFTLRDALLNSTDEKPRDLTVTGLTEQAKAPLLALLFDQFPRPILIITADEERAARLAEELQTLLALQSAGNPRVRWLPPRPASSDDASQEQRISALPAGPDERTGYRIAALIELSTNPAARVVTTPAALLQNSITRRRLLSAVVTLRTGGTIDRAELLRRLVDLGYQPVTRVDQTGQFAARGGVVDCFDPGHETPWRIELAPHASPNASPQTSDDGDQIESVRSFDPATQTSLAHLESVAIAPARESLDETEPTAGFLPPSTVLVFDEPAQLARVIDEIAATGQARGWLPSSQSAGGGEREGESLGRGGIANPTATLLGNFSPHGPPHDMLATRAPTIEPASPAAGWSAFMEWSRPMSRLTLSALGLETASNPDAEQPLTIDAAAASPQADGLGLTGTPWTATIERLTQLVVDRRIVILAHSPLQQQRLLELLREEGVPAEQWVPRPLLDLQHPPQHPPKHPPKHSPKHSNDAPGGVWVAVGSMAGGCRLGAANWLLLTEEELFCKPSGERPLPPSRRAKLAAVLSSLEELKLDGYVVHLHHGIGQYQGLQRLTIGGFESDFLVLRYAGGDRIYVPLDRLDLVQKYIGLEGSQPKLDRLGGPAWLRTTKRVKRAVEKLAKDLLALYAARSVAAAHAFPPDGPPAEAFAAGFEYEETPDQQRAIEAVSRALEQPHPMDLLVCGDVGYGKTEVAMRAAFKVAMEGKQTAVLVPTTLLAQQHARTFAARFAPFPIRIGQLSRFRSAAEQKEIRRALATGEIDILIGTHRLLQRDIEFRDLGLLIVDEEHRFGVRQKERIKTLKQSVHCLTLSATPIPRTLQMSLLSLRDLSLIETPPPDRRAVQTRLAPFDHDLIRSAIRFELARGGQCFFIHNRIQELERIGRLLTELVPEVKIVMAHGQMRTAQLEAAMDRFLSGRADLLLSTAIVESGLDIPRANTIIIHRADRFGLADLYQLRGRVGRSAVQAFAYLLVPDEAVLTPAARARLEAIRDFTELGAGFKIAARDLEIRGAGNLLGPQQSGQIAAIGYELYLQFLDEAIRTLRGERIEEAPMEPTLALKLSAYLPDTYVPDSHQRLAFYKRLASAADEPSLRQIEAQLADQFGPPPQEAVRLAEVMTLRLLAKQLRVQRIESIEPDDAGETGPQTGAEICLHFDRRRPPAPEEMKRVMPAVRRPWRFAGEWCLALRYPTADWASLYPLVRADLQRLAGCVKT
jgi:transcription-repair coupling factor (superfamily II helicase)